MLFVLSACGGGAAAPTTTAATTAATTASSSSPAATQASATPAAAKTLIAKTAKGDITIPAELKRVVAAYYHGTLAALGINPIEASKEWWMGSPFLKDQEAKMDDIGSPASVEKVASMNPDLIVINGFAEENVKEGETAVIINVREKKISFLGDNYGRGGEVIYNMLKLKAPDFVKKEAIDSGKQLVEISMETLPKYANVDHIFICMNDGTTEAQVKEILESPIWKTLPAVKNNKVHMLDYKTYLHYDPSKRWSEIRRTRNE